MHDIFYYDYSQHIDIKDIIPVVANSKTEYAWLVLEGVDTTGFDFRYVPNKYESLHVHAWPVGSNPNHYGIYLVPVDVRLMGMEYDFHYHTNSYPLSDPTLTGWLWEVSQLINYDEVDRQWLPDSWDKESIHKFSMAGTEQLSYVWLVNVGQEQMTVKHHKGNYKFWRPIPQVTKLEDMPYPHDWVWLVNESIDYTGFDFDWLPDFWDAKFDHGFAMQGTTQLSYTWLCNISQAVSQGAKFHVSDLQFKEIKKVYRFDEITWGKDEFVWVINDAVDYNNFNFNWLPDAWDKSTCHAFAMQGTTQLAETFLVNTRQKYEKTKYHVSDLTYTKIKKYFKPLSKIAFTDEDMFVWSCDDRIDYSEFNFAWLPDAWDLKKIHAFAMKDTEQLAYTFIKHRDCAIDAEIKYHKSDLKFKELTLLDQNLDDVLTKFSGQDQFVWIKDSRIDYANFNFDWLPDAWDKNKLHYFAMRGTEQLAYTAVVNPKYYDKTLESVYHASDLTFAQRYVKTWDSEIKVNLTEKIKQDPPEHEWTWYTDERINYDNFDFSWLPDAWDKSKVNAFCMKNAEQLSYTWIIHRDCDLNNLKFKYHASDLEFNDGVVPIVFWPKLTDVHLESDNLQDNMRIIASKLAFGSEWIWICDERIDYSDFDFSWLPDAWDSDFIHCFTVKGRDRLSYTWLVRADNLHKDARYKYHKTDLMLNNHYDVIELDMLMDGSKSQYKPQRFLGTMEDALKTAARKADKEWLWVLSNCCDYDNFSLDYLPELDEVEYTHCWPSGSTQKGDTFLIHIPTYLQTNKFKFNFDHKALKRKPWPIIEYNTDNLAEAIKANPSKSLYTIYKHVNCDLFSLIPDVCLWEKRPVYGFNRSHSVSMIPRDCVVKKEIYEYPYLLQAEQLATDPITDVIFISNGESQAERNWQQCKKIFGFAKRVDGVNGRLASYQAAANLSKSDWFLAVFAKCRVLDVYDSIGFGWQPDYWQQSKHYIFLNKNLETELIYGHMAPIAYNKKLMLANQGGLDMTLAQEHVVVPITLSETDLSDDPWLAWRTAFREVIKLNYYAEGELNVEGEYRLWAWQTKGSEWSQRGAIDAMTYIRENGLAEEAVMPTVEWQWLEEYFKKIYSADITEVITRSTSLSDK